MEIGEETGLDAAVDRLRRHFVRPCGFEVDLPSNAENVKETAIYRALRAAAEGKVTQVPPESHATEDDAAKVKKHRARAPRP